MSTNESLATEWSGTAPGIERAQLRTGGWAGLAGVGLMLASLPLAPPWPDVSAPTDAVSHYFHSYRTMFLAQVWLSTAGVTLLLLWAAAWQSELRTRKAALSGSAVLAGMTLFSACFYVFWMPWLVVALRPELSPDTVRALYDLGLMGQFVGVGMPLSLLFGTLAWGTRATRALPGWQSALCALAVPINLVLAACTAKTGPFAVPGPIGLGSILLFTVLIIATSVVMVRGRAAG